MMGLLRKPVTVHRKGSKTNVPSWKGTKVFPGAGYQEGRFEAPALPGLAYDSNKRVLYGSLGEEPKGAIASFITEMDMSTGAPRYIKAVDVSGQVWYAATSAPGSLGVVRAVNEGQGKFLAVTDTAACISSADGKVWTSVSIPAINPRDVFYADTLDLWVMVGNSGVILTSPTGLGGSWTSRTSGVSTTLFGITFTGSLLVVVGASGTIVTSPDGVTWTDRTATSGTSQSLMGVTHSTSLGLSVAVGANGTIRVSTDTITWNGATSGSSAVFNKVRRAGGLFLAVGTAGAIYTSTTGTGTWTQRASGLTSSELRGISYNGRTFVIVGFTGTGVTSSDGTNWALYSAAGADLYGAAYSSSLFRFVAGGVSGTLRASDAVFKVNGFMTEANRIAGTPIAAASAVLKYADQPVTVTLEVP